MKPWLLRIAVILSLLAVILVGGWWVCGNRAISGKVISTDIKKKEVGLDIGSEDGVQQGMYFIIKFAQGGVSEPNAKVIRIETASCVISYPGCYMIPVQVGDTALRVTPEVMKEIEEEREAKIKAYRQSR